MYKSLYSGRGKQDKYRINYKYRQRMVSVMRDKARTNRDLGFTGQKPNVEIELTKTENGKN